MTVEERLDAIEQRLTMVRNEAFAASYAIITGGTLDMRKAFSFQIEALENQCVGVEKDGKVIQVPLG